MTKPWQNRITQDKLNIFVSSRIVECKDERRVAHAAIHSLNHQPILFEHLGSKTYPSRDLYLSRLRDSQAMVAIFRLGYGYIDQANGMQISGLEDEYQFAKREGIDALFYVWAKADEREPRLQKIIDEISARQSISYYDAPEQLHERIRNDITALITDRILSASSHSGVMYENAASVLARTLSSVGVIVRRVTVMNHLIEQLEASPTLCIYGPGGIGKTTISAQLAQEIGGNFVRASGLTPKDLFAVCSDLLNGYSAAEATPFSTLEGARLAMAAAWAESSNVTLILDECDYIPELIEALTTGGGMSPSKRIVYTSRNLSPVHPNIEVPPLTTSEIDEIIAKSPWQELSGEQVTDGNPLLLQHKLMQKGAIPPAKHLSDGGSASEILTYLALNPLPLTAEQLIALRADDSYSIESLGTDIKHLGAIVDDSPRGYRLMHAKTAEVIASEVRKSPQRYKFFVHRLVRLAETNGLYRQAYGLAASLEDGSARKFVNRAIREAAQLGDWRLGVALTDQLLSEALDTESKNEALHLMLSLVYPLELLGDVVRAGEILTRAKPLANQLGEAAQLFLEEVEISSRARRAMLASDVEDLKQIYHRYEKDGRDWDQARLGLELSAIFLAAKNYVEAVEILRPTLSTFVKLGDDYGVDIAQRNLASALSAIPGSEVETEELIAVITDRAGDTQDARRQRAWLCNILTRRLRSSGRHDEAEATAKEAVEIATELGDESLRAINLVNLGNVYRGRKQPILAISTYEAAAVSGQKCGRHDIEADASRLVAGIYNDFEETGEARARRQKAKFYAQHAVGLARNTVNYEAFAGASWELGEALEELGEVAEAANAIFGAAAAFRIVTDQEGYSSALTHAAGLCLPDHVDIYLRGITETFGIEPTNPQHGLADQFLGLVEPIMEIAPKGSLIHLLGNHLCEVWLHLSQPMRRGLAYEVVERFHGLAQKPEGQIESWRILYSAIAVATLVKDIKPGYLHQRIANSLSRCTQDLFVRDEGDGSRVWTLILNVGRRVTVTIACLDVSPASNLAALALASFMKAFEKELYEEVIGGEASIDELMIHICSFDEMPVDLRQTVSRTMGLDKILSGQPCTVSRPTDFKEISPTCVFLSNSFLKEVSFGRQGGSALQVLLGLTLVEVAFQLLQGEVEMDTIRPKVVSLVRRARP